MYVNGQPKEAELPKEEGHGIEPNAGTVGGLRAVTADKAGPNKLVATSDDGKLPIVVIKGAVLVDYANNAAAVAAGLAVGSFYRTAGAVMIVI